MRSEGYGTRLVCQCVCVSVATYSRTTRNKAVKKQYQRVQCHTGLIYKQVIFVNPVMARNTSNMLMSTASPRPVFAALHTVKASKVTQKSSRESQAAFKRYLQIQLSGRSEKRSTEHVDL